jgi:hypothetical protein
LRDVKLFTSVRRDLGYSSGTVVQYAHNGRKFDSDLFLIKQRGSIMWTRDELVSYSFLFAVTVAGLGLVALAFG